MSRKISNNTMKKIERETDRADKFVKIFISFLKKDLLIKEKNCSHGEKFYSKKKDLSPYYSKRK